MIEFDNVSCTFVKGAGIVDASFNIDKGEFVCVIGPTGAGKTTLLRLIYMDVISEKGRVIVDKYDSSRIKRRQIPLLRRKVGMVFQEFNLLSDRNVFENVALPLRVIGVPKKEIKDRVNRVLDELEIDHRWNHLPSELSGGEQQIVSLARAVVKNPLVILADEPTGNLDPVASYKILTLLEKINENGTAILFATHSYNLVKDRGHRFMDVIDCKVRT
ncbi:MAG: ATP-binding cassette domain-containing protein [Candidatus Marinimicrobia bacterium]|nr:ATP-binding cassette domain-containing protein [Candidatus Neomarinimicrobiota bacterium]